jgi:hypothetical protein
MAALQDRALTQGSSQRDSREIDAYDREADAQTADGDGERDDFDNYAADERDDDGDDAADDAPRYAPRYADAAPERTYSRSGGYGSGSYVNYGPAADRGNYNAPYGNLPDAYRPGAYWVDAEGPPARPHMVRGPDGHWYLLLYFGH